MTLKADNSLGNRYGEQTWRDRVSRGTRRADPLKSAATGAGTAVLLADFHRAGDGDDDSFTAQMIVSDTDLATGIPGEQNLWVQGVGCGTAVVHFSN